MYHDIIGDIHGHADRLEGLLMKLGYRTVDGLYFHENRKAVFVGDFIDRGIQNRKVIQIVKAMAEEGFAHAIMGNHEYNAICYHTPKSESGWLRPHCGSKLNQHKNFLKEYPVGQQDTNEVIDWFKSLPLFMEFDSFRVIHACWDKKIIKASKKYLNNDNSLNQHFIVESATKSDDEFALYNIIERLLKGVEIKLPYTHSFNDKDGKPRHHIRVKWWQQAKTTYKQLAFGYEPNIVNNIPDIDIPDDSIIPFYGNDDKPVFFGHYWMNGTPELQKNNVCCVDYSAGKGEKLVCYSFSNHSEEGRLDRSNFTWF